MGHFGLKKTSSCLLKNLVYTLEATFSVRLSWKFVRMFVFIKSCTSLKMGHDGSKTRSLAQTLEKPCVCSGDQIFGLILMKLVQSFAVMKPCTFLKIDHIGSKTRSLGQIIEYPMLVTKGLWFKSLLLNSILIIRKAEVSDSRFIMALLLAPLAVGQRAYVMARCPSCVRLSVRASVRLCINFFFKHLLRWNYLSDFDEISQKCSHHGPLQNFLK